MYLYRHSSDLSMVPHSLVVPGIDRGCSRRALCIVLDVLCTYVTNSAALGNLYKNKLINEMYNKLRFLFIIYYTNPILKNITINIFYFMLFSYLNMIDGIHEKYL